jgi:hypothetical protein
MWHATVSCVICVITTERLQWRANLSNMKSPLFTKSFHPFYVFKKANAVCKKNETGVGQKSDEKGETEVCIAKDLDFR